MNTCSVTPFYGIINLQRSTFFCHMKLPKVMLSIANKGMTTFKKKHFQYSKTCWKVFDLEMCCKNRESSVMQSLLSSRWKITFFKK